MARTKKLPPPQKVPVTRKTDSWENALTGLGVLGKDKRLGNSFSLSKVDQLTAEEIWRGSDIAARIVETPVDEMLREGFQIQIEGEQELAEDIDCALRDLGALEKVREALYWARAYGGSAILLGADDGSKNLELPLEEDRIRKFDWLSVLTPRELWPTRYYANPIEARYGEIATYRLVPIDTVPGSDVSKMPVIHESRLIRFSGVRTSRGATLRNIIPGWNDSIFNRILQVISDFETAWQGTAVLFTDFSTPTLKIKGLAKLIASVGAVDLGKRAAALEMARSIARVTIIDSEEEYKRETTTVAGLSDLLDKMALRLAAAVPMPVSLLMGQAPAGLNATGDSDIRWWYDAIANKQEREVKPAIKRLTELLILAKDGPTYGRPVDNWTVNFPALWQLTELEQATLRKTQADADSLYITNQVLTPEEVATSRFGGDSYSTETQIDSDLRAEMMKEPDHQLERLDPPAPDPLPGASVPGVPGVPIPGKSVPQPTAPPAVPK